MYTYSHERHFDKWETLADTFDELLDELNQESEDDSDVFVDVEDFDLEEIL